MTDGFITNPSQSLVQYINKPLLWSEFWAEFCHGMWKKKKKKANRLLCHVTLLKTVLRCLPSHFRPQMGILFLGALFRGLHYTHESGCKYYNESCQGITMLRTVHINFPSQNIYIHRELTQVLSIFSIGMQHEH